MKFPEKFLLKLPEGTLARVDAVSSNRSEFIRDALDRALHSGVHNLPPKNEKPLVPKNSGSKPVDQKKNFDAGALKETDGRKSSDDDRLLDYLRCGVRTEREIAREVGWPAMRVSKAVARLGAAGKVKFKSGAIEVCDG